ncbi:MAG: cytochrome P450 [Hyphomicrobiaceae bacterium]
MVSAGGKAFLNDHGIRRLVPDEAAAFAANFDVRQPPPAFYADPFPFYHALRDYDPVRRMPDGSVFLTRYRDVEQIYKDPRLFSSDKKQEFKPKYGNSPLYEHHTSSLVFNDPPLHTRVRRSIAGALAPRAIAAMEGSLVALVDRLLDAAEAKGQFDLIDDFAAAIPVEVIGTLLGMPAAERGPLRGWSLAILGALEPLPTPTQLDRGNDAVVQFLDDLRRLVAARRKSLRDPNEDVLTRLIVGEPEGERLAETELLHNCIFILNAGHETTTNLIGNGLHALLEWPGERRRLQADQALVRTAVEEFLRFESSNQLGNRISTDWSEIGGVRLPPSTPVTLCIGAANRDPQQFPRPDVLDLGRTPNRHVAFATGIHACVGMSLARLEGKIAIERFVRRFPGYELAGEPRRSGRVRFRGFLSLPVRCRPAGA